jgi:hypothetical protein
MLALTGPTHAPAPAPLLRRRRLVVPDASFGIVAYALVADDGILFEADPHRTEARLALIPSAPYNLFVARKAILLLRFFDPKQGGPPSVQDFLDGADLLLPCRQQTILLTKKVPMLALSCSGMVYDFEGDPHPDFYVHVGDSSLAEPARRLAASDEAAACAPTSTSDT